jgi:tetratricopeptide (TPR) repeat protein
MKEDLLERVRVSIEASETTGTLTSPSAPQPDSSHQATPISEPVDDHSTEAPQASDPPNQSDKNGRIEDFEATLTGVNFTDLALTTLDANIFDGALRTLDEEFADQPFVKARLLHTLGSTMIDVGLYERGAGPLEEAIAIRRRELGDDDPEMLASINRLAVLLSQAGRAREAEPYAREALERRRRVLGEEHTSTIVSINTLGLALHMQEKYAEAAEYFREAMEIRERVLGPNHPRTIGAMGNLGLSLSLLGTEEEAELHYREALDRARLLRDDDRRLLWTLNRLGTLLRSQGRLGDAEPLLREAADGYRRVLGEGHSDTIHAIHQLGLLHQQLENWEEAERLGAQAVAGARRGMPYWHGMTAFALLRHAQALVKLQRFEEAEREMLEALAIFRAVFGSDNWRIDRTTRAIADLYAAWHAVELGAGHDSRAAAWRLGEVGDRNDVVRAADNVDDIVSHERHLERRENDRPIIADARLADFERALASVNFTSLALKLLDGNIFAQALVAVHEEFADQPLVKAQLLQTLAVTLRELGLTGRALSPQKEALSIRRRELGNEHPDTLMSISNMAVLLANSGRFVEAEPFAREALETARRNPRLGNELRATLNALNALGLLLPHLGRIDEAEACYREALAISRRVYGNNHPVTQTLIGNLAFAHSEQSDAGKWSQAEALYREALEGRRQLYGNDHPRTLWVHTNLGVLLRRSGELESAKEHLHQALDGYRRERGEEHAKTSHAYHQLGIVLREMGELEEAERLGAHAVRHGRPRFHAGNVGSTFFLVGHGRTLAEMGRFKEAEHRMLEAHAIFEQRAGSADWRTLHAAEALADLYAAWHEVEPDAGHDAKVAEWRARLAGK